MIDLATATAAFRGLHLAATLSLLGAAGFVACVLPAGAYGALRVRVLRTMWMSGLVALAAGLAWFVLEAAVIAGAASLADLFDAVPVVAWHTRFGNVVLARLVLVALGSVLSATGGRTAWLVLASAALAAGLEGLIGHAGATGGAIGYGLLASEALHLIAAGAWLGALIPLLLGLRALPPLDAAVLCERFSPLGLACVLVIAGTGIAQSLQLVSSVPALVGTAYGQILLLKIALFAVALLLAALNRLALTDRLSAHAPSARRHLMASIAAETLAGMAIIGAAAFLSSVPPAAHTPPVWPFAWRLSLVTVNEEPDFRREVITSLMLIGLAAALLAAALARGRLRWPALLLLAAAVTVRGPSLNLLTVEAYPTSFQASPTDFAAASIVRGETLYASNCASCHGASGSGDGPAGARLRIRPADLNDPMVLTHADGDMFWWLSHGMDDPEGGLAMPGFAATLSDADRWALIDYVRARAAGRALAQDSVPVRMPSFAIACNGVAASGTADLRGHAVLVVMAGNAQPPVSNAVTLDVGAGDDAPAPGACVATDPAAEPAFAVLAGLPRGGSAGTAFLADPNLWLRSVHSPSTGGGWHTAAELVAAIQRICTYPVEPVDGGAHEHHH